MSLLNVNPSMGDHRKSPTNTSSNRIKKGISRTASRATLSSQKTSTQLTNSTTTSDNQNNASSISSQQGSAIQVTDESRKVIDMLRKEVDTLKYELTNAETEKETYVFQIGEIKKKNRRDLERLEQELVERKEKQRSMEEKLSRVEQVEDAIIKLYLELKDRSFEVVGSDESRREIEKKEREELRKENPIVILDRLKANLRTLLVFKDDYENELKDQIRRRKTEAEYKVEELKETIEKLEREKNEYKDAAIKAIEIKDQALRLQQEGSDRFATEVNSLKQENVMLANVLSKKEQEIDKLHEMIDRRDSILRHREVQMMKITQLESKIKNDKTKHQFDINREKSEKYQVMKKYDNDINFYQKLESDKKEMEQDLTKMRDEVRSLKTNASREKVQQLTEANTKLQEKVNKLTEELNQCQSEARSMKIQVSNLRRTQVEMKQQYLTIFNANTDEKKKRKAQEEATLRDQIERHFHDNAERNPQLASYYKKKLKEKEKEVEELNKRVKRMILHQNRETQVEENFHREKTQLIGELTQLRKQLPNVYPDEFSSIANENLLSQRNAFLEEKLRDYENLQVITKSQTLAFEKLKTAKAYSSSNPNTDDDYSPTPSTPSKGSDSPQPRKIVEFKSSRPQSATYISAKKNTVAQPPPGSRPLSAGASRGRPGSAKIGSSRLSQVGAVRSLL